MNTKLTLVAVMVMSFAFSGFTKNENWYDPFGWYDYENQGYVYDENSFQQDPYYIDTGYGVYGYQDPYQELEQPSDYTDDYQMGYDQQFQDENFWTDDWENTNDEFDSWYDDDTWYGGQNKNRPDAYPDYSYYNRGDQLNKADQSFNRFEDNEPPVGQRERFYERNDRREQDEFDEREDRRENLRNKNRFDIDEDLRGKNRFDIK